MKSAPSRLLVTEARQNPLSITLPLQAIDLSAVFLGSFAQDLRRKERALLSPILSAVLPSSVG